MVSIPFGRGSEGPRGIIAFYYAFLHTARHYWSCAFCPIVIDAPNQQGQDDMQRLMRFIIDKRLPNSQVIIATEDLFGLTEADATILHVGKRANQLLDEDRYDEMSNAVRPYLEHLINRDQLAGVRTYPSNECTVPSAHRHFSRGAEAPTRGWPAGY